MRLSHSTFASILLLLGSCSGCILFLPRTPGLIYRGDIQNVHGFNETGRGGNLYRTGDADFVFNGEISLLPSPGRQLAFKVGAEQSAGTSVIIECDQPSHQRLVCTTKDGSLRAWLVRDFENPCSIAKSQTVEALATTPSTEPDYSPILTAAQRAGVPLPLGVYRLEGSIEIQWGNQTRSGPGVDFLHMNLVTVVPVSVDEKWLSENERATRQALTKFGPVGQLTEDSAAWSKLRARQAKVVPLPARIGGTFEIEQCLDYSEMP